jgi:hypothetical protein
LSRSSERVCFPGDLFLLFLKANSTQDRFLALTATRRAGQISMGRDSGREVKRQDPVTDL